MSASASKKKRKELDEQGLSPRAVAEQKAKDQKKKTLRNAGIVVLCIAVALGAIFAVISLVNRPDYDTDAAVATVGGEKITVPMYDIFYNQNASNLYNYGYSYFIQTGTALSQQNNVFGEGTMEDFFKEYAASAIETTYNYYIKAKESGYKLTDEAKQSISDELEAMKTAAQSYGFGNVDKFMAAYYGKGCTADDYEDYLEISAIYQGYYNQLQEEFKPTAEEIQAAYDKDPGAFDLVNFTYKISSAESSTVPAADSEPADGSQEGDTTAPVTTETYYSDEAKAAAREKAEGYVTEMPEDASTGSYNKSTATSYLGQEIADWLFDAERKEGDAKVFVMNENETSFYTVRFNSRDTNEYCRVNANVLTITKDKEDAELAEGEQSAQEKFDALAAAIKDGMTDEEFSTAVTALGYSVSNTSVTNTYAIEEIRSWLYDSSRKAGDLLTSYASDTSYYVVRYVSTDEDTYRDALVKDSLWTEFTESIATANKIEIDEELLKEANTDLIFNDTSSNSEG